jgi:type I restriction enzyme M protein
LIQAKQASLQQRLKEQRNLPMKWKNSVSRFVKNAKDKVVELNLDTKSVKYLDPIKKLREVVKVTGDEEIVRAFLIARLVNQLGYKPELIEIEKDYQAGRKPVMTPRIDVILRDAKGKAFLFIECKAPTKFEEDKQHIKGQLFELAKLEGNVKYLVYYTLEEVDDELRDKPIVIELSKFKDYEDWIDKGSPSIANVLPAHYNEARKEPLIKGGKRDLRKRFEPNELKALATDLHNVLWGGGGTGDTEVFTSLVNIILAKIQDEYDRADGEEYRFQIHQYGKNIEQGKEIFERVNNLYRKALKEQLNVTEDLEQQFVVNQQKFSLNKLIYAVQALEEFSFVDGKSTIDGKDILGDFFEQIQRDGYKQTKGQFFTPINVVRFLLYTLELDELALKRLNENGTLPYIIDPACGSSTFLIEAMKMVTQEIKYRRRNEVKKSRQAQDRFEEFFMPDNREHRWAQKYIYAIEHNFELGTATKVNMILHGDGSTNVFVKDGLLPFRFYQKAEPNALNTHDVDSLYNNKDINAQFDVLVSNPPFSVNLDNETKNRLNFTFVFHGKKNSENLFIERYYQLLKENGRLGVVLPESVFDTTENKYIRLFLYKYFWVRAVVSLPQLTFEPYTSTKTSLLFAQKKTRQEVEEWNEVWNKHSSDYGKLKTRAENYVKVYVEGEPKTKFPSIKGDEDEDIRNNLSRFLRVEFGGDELALGIKELVETYRAQIEEAAKIDKDTVEVFGHVNTSWVFSGVAQELKIPIFMAEAAHIGYKRSKRGERAQPNELFDVEIAPEKVEAQKVKELYETNRGELRARIAQTEADLKKLKPEDKKKNGYLKRLHNLKAELEEVENEERGVLAALGKYYDGKGNLLEAYKTRFDDELLFVFQLPRMEKFKSSYVLIRQTDHKTLLDFIRKEKLWR